MSDRKQKEINIEFKISSIELIEKSFHAHKLPEGQPSDTQFELAINVSIDKANKKIANILQVKLKMDNMEGIAASITVGCTFDIINFEELITNNGDAVNVPETILETLNIITIGTVRGIMFNEFKGTWLHNSILPIIDPKSFSIANALINKD